LAELDEKGVPTYLVNPSALKGKPEIAYIAKGELEGVSRHYTTAKRAPWWKAEKREIPDWIFTYLGRKRFRFLENQARILPLTTLSCIYARDRSNLAELNTLLREPNTLRHLELVGKTYGRGAIKVEPKSLEKMPIEIRG
jgi:hypothetical protein